MAAKKSSKKSTPNSMDALDKFKYEVANELGVNLKSSNLSSKDAGKVGGNMVKKMINKAKNNLKD